MEVPLATQRVLADWLAALIAWCLACFCLTVCRDDSLGAVSIESSDMLNCFIRFVSVNSHVSHAITTTITTAATAAWLMPCGS